MTMIVNPQDEQDAQFDALFEQMFDEVHDEVLDALLQLMPSRNQESRRCHLAWELANEITRYRANEVLDNYDPTYSGPDAGDDAYFDNN